MAIFKHLTKDEIKRDYDHYGLFMGLIPVYVGDVHGECRLAVRNWLPDWLFDVADFICSLCPGDYYVIKLTGIIK
ncbi:hypothetical protein XBJ1_0688 [Xenorhabdus bovienii SS-2004]|uniref:Uncharacterized protein n=1 Tax=Xenorhabdus bovienii (strain SS-2004) TaxID=406818 RepID=D3UWJ4_XENBS|nr:hypothetical protein [Xenorhabdus bovienii]CBJ79829.1 hypothetical protein XBJ1_0688 [Xenorhabdus bovienii SS-2004]